jgi:hypothetical protein
MVGDKPVGLAEVIRQVRAELVVLVVKGNMTSCGSGWVRCSCNSRCIEP